ncbi:hypothetical protein Taro_037194 [Colocasia esculenta]|uniref:Uncharacterized protein n=1 Tax=Colocasia esculenta TaxID=4460 RepID=A0A843W910_COLES|nr:hypothetical protein [Colocasia esculenta]
MLDIELLFLMRAEVTASLEISRVSKRPHFYKLCECRSDLVYELRECESVHRFCHGSVDTPIDGVDTGSESLKVFHEDRVKCVDTAPGSVDTSPRFQKTQLPDWDSVSTQLVFHEDRVKCVDTAPGSVNTSPRFQKTQLPDWDSVSTQPVSVSTLVPSPRRPILCNWDSVSTHSVTVSTHSG